MLKDNWLERQLATIKELLEEGQQAVRENKLVQAEDKLKEAGVILDSAETINFAVLKMRYVVHNERAVIASRTGDVGTALGQYRKALAACEEARDKHDQPMALEIITTSVNLGGLYAGIGHLTEAEAISRKALDLIHDLGSEGGEHALLMKVFANHHLGAALHTSPDPESAYGPLKDAVEAAASLAPGTLSSAKPLLIEIHGRIADIAARKEQWEEAIDQDTQGADIALAMHESSSQQVFLQGYSNCLMRLVGHCRSAGRLDDAEDAIFKLLDIAPGHPQIIERAEAFYKEILALTDEELEAGGLPREEAEESLAEILSGAKA